MISRRTALWAVCGTFVASIFWLPNLASAAVNYRSVLIRNVPHVHQKPDFCGEACAAMVLTKLGHRYDQDAVFDAAGLDADQARGCYTRELKTALETIGFRPGVAWYKISVPKADAELEQHWASLHADLGRGVPSIICTRYDAQPKTTEHFRLILGYDADTDEVIYHEPADRDGAYRRMARSTMLSLWPLKYDRKEWTVVRMPLISGRIRTATQPPKGSRFTDADYAQHIMQLKQKLPHENFTIHIERPFVVVGDEAAEVVRRRSAKTVRWAVDKLKQDYFAKDPDHIIDIWLFKDKPSYDKHVKELFGDSPGTPFGYYSPTHRALVMNISTGGGTLVHEIVHPFIASNFRQCPSWFNEGLASLYEQCGEEDGHIHGYTNWRLDGLQRTIRAKRLPTFVDLCNTTTREFYDDDRGSNYGQARYLCYYLQQQGKLVDYYKQFVKAADEDPTGYATLQSLLGERDMAAFQKQWEKYVLGLRR